MNYKIIRIKIDYVTHTKKNVHLAKNQYCKDFPNMPTIVPAHDRVIAIGDTHGDYNATIETFKIAKLIDDDLNWIAEPKDTIVVQLGDQIDRCRPHIHNCLSEKATIDDEANDVKILKLFTNLHNKASKVGGAVYSLLGNHEIMNAQGKLSYVSKKGLDEFKQYTDSKNRTIKFNTGWEGRQYAFKPGNELANFLACTRQSAIIVGSFLFVHAGIVPDLLKKYNIKKKEDIILVNKVVKYWLLGIIDEAKIKKLLDDHKISPFWPRIFGNIPPNKKSNFQDCKILDDVFQVLNINGMIIGHTPQFITNNTGINGTCDNRLWRTDHGVSKAFSKYDVFYSGKHRQVQVLEILNDKDFRILKSQ